MEIYRPREYKQKAHVENADRDEKRKRLADMNAFLQEHLTSITEYDEHLVRWLIENVAIYDDRFAVELKSCFSIDIKGQAKAPHHKKSILAMGVCFYISF